MKKKFGSKIVEKPLPNEERRQELKVLIDQYRDITTDIQSYIYDLRIDAQNRLLDKLFDHRLQPRKPKDKKFKVITTEPEYMRELKEYFENETDWGKFMKNIAKKTE